MSNKHKKYYVVFQGREPGIYDNWQDVVSNTKGFPNNVFKGFESQQEAEDAFYKFHPDIVGAKMGLDYYQYINDNTPKNDKKTGTTDSNQMYLYDTRDC